MKANRTGRGTQAALLALGASAVTTQIVLLREFLSVFQGNELVIGIVLACWMVLTGAGAFLGRSAHRGSSPARGLPALLLALGVTPVVTVFLLRFLRNIGFTAGSMIPIIEAFLTAVVLLTPFCLISGFSFASMAAALPGRQPGNPAAAAYFWESLGSAAGGALVSILLIPRLETFQVLLIVLSLNAGLAWFIARKHGPRHLSYAAASALGAAVLLLALGNLDLVTRRFLFPGQDIAYFRDTPYGNLTITRQEEQISLFENGVLMFSSQDTPAKEENVHYAMAQHPSPRRVLLIGGGVAGTTLEVLKYDVERLDYAEMNPWMIQIGRGFTKALEDPRIRIVGDDGRRHVRVTDERYDVALISLPDPETIQLNRFYTVEFFRTLKSILTDGGVVSTSLLPAAEYQGPEARRSSSVLYATLHRCFANVLVVPGLRNYFLASDAPLDIRIGQLIERRQVATTYVNRYYLDDRMLEQRSALITRALDPASPVNADFEPISYHLQLEYWLSYFGAVPAVWVLILAAGGAVLIWRFSAVGAGIFIGGFIGVSLEILLLLVFQTLAGSLYSMTGILITAFMAGLAAGSLYALRFLSRHGMGGFAAIQLVVAVTCILLPPIIAGIRDADLTGSALQVLFALIAFLLASMFGMEFAVASSIRGGEAASTASELYGLDLAGSALGALVVSVYAIPVIGVAGVTRLLGWASAAGAAVCIIARKRN